MIHEHEQGIADGSKQEDTIDYLSIHDISDIQTVFHRPYIRYGVIITTTARSVKWLIISLEYFSLFTYVSSRYSTVDGNPFSFRLAFSASHFSNLPPR